METVKDTEKKCPVCERDMSKEWGTEGLPHHTHVIATKSLFDGHVHVHGDLENKEVMNELIDAIKSDAKIEAPKVNELKRKEFVFKNRQRIGDMLMFTCAVRDFKKAYPDTRVNVVSTAGHIWDYNPHIDRTLLQTAENLVEIGPGMLTNKSNSLDWHMSNSFRMSIESKLGIAIPQGESRPDIWLTQEEYDAPRVIDKPYWVICVNGEKGWGCKMYPMNKWQEVVSACPDITFVQIGSAEDNPPRLKGANVIDYVGKTQSKDAGIRDLFKLFLNAEGSIGLVSFHMHLSGALYKPAVIVAGGREPVSFTRYAGHAYLSNDGMLPCAIKACWHCSIDACTNLVIREDTLEKKIPKCADIIESEDVVRAIRGYYKGGRLQYGIASVKPKLRNVVPTPASKPKELEAKPLETLPEVNTYGMKFGGGSLTDRDWQFIKATIDKYAVKSVLEFGAGLSTLLLNDTLKRVVTFECNQGWINKIKALNAKCDIQLWDGKNPSNPLFRLYDMAFVDGPAGDFGRNISTQLAALYSNVVIVHDAGREHARTYQDLYLKPFFDGPFKGGHRCHLWVRKENMVKGGIEVQPMLNKQSEQAISEAVKEVPIPGLNPIRITSGGEVYQVKPRAKTIKVVSTARGWGGCARSVTTIMKMLLDAGHKVEFIPFRNSVSSSEYKQALDTTLKDVKVSLNYGPIKEACDVMLVYADDYIWEFKTPEVAEVFSEINAEKKIMMLNYRRGDVGKLEWTKGWDLYAFLNSSQEKELLDVYPEAKGKTKVLPPCTLLEPFLAVKPDYENGIRIVRHSSQGDTKFAKDGGKEILTALHCREDLTISMLPGPSFAPKHPRYFSVPRTADPNVIAKFLSTGNLFWYSLPEAYMDMGPRVALESLSAGVPVLADNWGGMLDRVTSKIGWLCSKKEKMIDIIENVTSKELEQRGIAAKEYAYENFRPEVWISLLTGEK